MRTYLLSIALSVAFILHSESYNFARLDNTRGLSNNQVTCTLKDSRGFIWIGTNYGLNRYDGHNVKIYQVDKNDTTSISYNAISSVQEDITGNLWVNSNYSNYIVYDMKTERFIRNPTPLLLSLGVNFKPNLVEIDDKKNIFFYREQDGLYKYDVIQKKLKHFQQSSSPSTFSKGLIVGIKSKHGYVWVLFKTGLLERFNEKINRVDFRNTYAIEKPGAASLTKHLFIDSDNCPWIFPGINDKGLLKYDATSSQWIYFGKEKKDFRGRSDRLIASDLVRSVTQDFKGQIWIASDHGGVNVFDRTFSHNTLLRNDPLNPNSLSQNSAISLYCDNTGIMWVGTYKNGLAYYHSGMFKFDKSPLYFYHNENLETKDCNTLYEDRSGSLWIGTNGGGLLKREKASQSYKLYRNIAGNPSSISSDIVISMLEDRKGFMWFGTFLGGLNQKVGERFIRYLPDAKNSNSLSSKSVYGIAEDAQQNLWLGTLGSGVNKLDAARKNFSQFKVPSVSGTSYNFVLSMFSNKTNSVYLSTTNCTYILNTTTNKIAPLFRNKAQLSQLSDLITFNTLVDSRKQVWMATDNGINVYNPKSNTITYISKASGLPSNQVVSLIEDNNGNVWAGTRNGLACIYCKEQPSSGHVKYSVVSFDEKDGLLNPIFNQNAIFKNKQGLIYIGCTKGYTVFDPKSIAFNTLVPQPRFTELQISNDVITPGVKYKNRVILETSVTLRNKIVLNYDEKNFSVNFSAMSYIHPEKNRYRYKLVGLDEEWTQIKSGVGSVTYSNLNQGTYHLIVYASNNDNIWSKVPITMEIVIRPPFWFSWWAITLYFVLGVVLLWYIIKFNLRKQQREFENARRINEAKQVHDMDEMKFRFFTNISHEFRTPLTLIIGPVEKLLGELKSKEQQTMLSIILRNANGLLELVNQLLDFRKLDVQKDTLNKSVGDVVAFVKDICYSFTELADSKSIKFSFLTSMSELRMEFDPEKLRKIVSNLLSNAFKFTPDGGKIDVNLSLIQPLNDDKKLFKMTVSDSGIGIPAKDLDRIFERFYRVENVENGNQTGTGVGLHMVSEYVKLHLGTIDVKSTIGKGSIFSILIPATQEMHQEIISRKSTEDDAPEEVLSSEELLVSLEMKNKLPLMLVVDDNQDFRNFISALFANEYRILKAEDGEVAHKIILEKMPDIIICDVMMPKMDGLELCRLLKKDIRVSHIPIILLTAKAGEENKYRGLEAGAEDYIAKPFNMEMLSLKVSRIIERQKKIREQFKRKIDITTEDVEITSMDEKFVKKAVALVEVNIASSEFLVEDLCREMGMSRVYFYKKILALTDKTPSEFIRFIRLKRAADLLEKSQMFVNEVAYQVGFNDPKYFRKYFKDEYGVSPNEYKKKFVN